MCTLRIAFAAAASVLLGAQAARAGSDPAAIFQKKCTSCHTFGKGDLVGPDLRGVTLRRSRTWLRSWIRSSERTIASGDATASALFAKYRQQRMPDQPFQPEDIDALIDYLANGGPDRDRPQAARPASTAAPADVEHGRRLFAGAIPLSSGAAACSTCHSVRDGEATSGASFGGDLSHVYSRFQDGALASFLQRACYPRLAGVDPAAQLSTGESFAIRAYLRQLDTGSASTSPAKGGTR